MAMLPRPHLIGTLCAVALTALVAATPALALDTTGVVQETTAGTIDIAESAEARGNEAATSIIVDLKPGAELEDGMRIAPDGETVVLDIANDNLAQVERELATNPNVANVERDSQMKFFFNNTDLNDPMASAQWEHDAISLYGRALPSKTPLIAILDSGIDATHPEFRGYMPNGRLKIKRVYNAVNGSTDVRDDFGHGTLVSSIAAASANNNEGMSSVAPNSQIMMVKVGGTSGLRTSDAIKGLNWAVARGAKVVNMSFGTPDHSKAFEMAILKAANRGVVLVAAVGNEGGYIEGGRCKSGPNELNYPAGFPHVIGVGATTASGKRACFSNYGPEVDLVAPGVDVRAAVPIAPYAWGAPHNPTGYLPFQSQGEMVTAQGTSFAAPVVAGAAALVKARHPKWTSDQVAAALTNSARNIAAKGWDAKTGHGMLNVQKSVFRTRSGLFDILEVNDDIPLAKRKKAILKKGRSRRNITASIHRSNDPSDIYKVYVKKGKMLRTAARMNRGGRYRITIWKPTARTTKAKERTLKRYRAAQGSWSRKKPRASVKATKSGYYFVQLEAVAGSGQYRLGAKVSKR